MRSLVKGRSNYVSLRRLRGAQQRAPGLLFEDTARLQLNQIGRWARRPGTAAYNDLELSTAADRLGPGRKRHRRCLGRNCRGDADCFYYKARRAVFGAWSSSLSITPCSSAISPCAAPAAVSCPITRSSSSTRRTPWKTWPPIISGFRSAAVRVDYLLNKLFHQRQRPLPWPTHHPRRAERRMRTGDLRPQRASERFFNDINAWLASRPRPIGRVRPPAGTGESVRCRSEDDIVADPLSDELTKRWPRSIHHDCGYQTVAEEDKIELESRRGNRCIVLAQSLRQWLGAGAGGSSLLGRGLRRALGQRSPWPATIEVGAALRANGTCTTRCRRS